MTRSLAGRGHPLAIVETQTRMIESRGKGAAFAETLARHGLAPLRADRIDVLQMNLGKMCNQTCKHCHVDAGPDRVEVMTRETMERCLDAVEALGVPTVDLTGGAPEMNPEFRWLVARLSAMGRRVLDRCNLTILTVGRFADLPEFLAAHRVEVVASLPSYLARPTDSQRGDGVFEASVEAIRRLNQLGYGREGSGLVLNLVDNPVGAFLAPDQAAIEPEFRRELARRHELVFNRLFVLANMPINRFLEFLARTGQVEEYMERLVGAFNPRAVEGLMCRSMLSVGWDGRIFDCDFNAMLELPPTGDAPRHVADLTSGTPIGREIATGRHCFGCTAGKGSSCGGATVSGP